MKIQVGDLVKHTRSRGQLTCGIVTAKRGQSVDVLWSCGRHSAHVVTWLWLLEEK